MQALPQDFHRLVKTCIGRVSTIVPPNVSPLKPRQLTGRTHEGARDLSVPTGSKEGPKVPKFALRDPNPESPRSSSPKVPKELLLAPFVGQEDWLDSHRVRPHSGRYPGHRSFWVQH